MFHAFINVFNVSLSENKASYLYAELFNEEGKIQDFQWIDAWKKCVLKVLAFREKPYCAKNFTFLVDTSTHTRQLYRGYQYFWEEQSKLWGKFSKTKNYIQEQFLDFSLEW